MNILEQQHSQKQLGNNIKVEITINHGVVAFIDHVRFQSFQIVEFHATYLAGVNRGDCRLVESVAPYFRGRSQERDSREISIHSFIDLVNHRFDIVIGGSQIAGKF